jgi:enoyl-CoA hydratase
MDEIIVRRDGAVAVVRLNRPAARNAINAALAGQLCAAIEGAQDAGAIVVTGADPAFCAGLDLRELGVERLADLPRCAAAIAASEVPVIAAVNGPAVTGGLEVALACDLMVASERAAFADTHLRVGVYPGPVLVDLPRRVGEAWAREMSLTGNFVDAETALRIGLVNHVVPHDQLEPFVMELAQAMACHDRQMVVTMRRDWAATAASSREDAQRAHDETARRAGFRDGTGAGIAGHRDAVLERSRAQRGR